MIGEKILKSNFWLDYFNQKDSSPIILIDVSALFSRLIVV